MFPVPGAGYGNPSSRDEGIYQFIKDTATSCEYLSRDVNARTVLQVFAALIQ
jgi:hypothetical protein